MKARLTIRLVVVAAMAGLCSHRRIVRATAPTVLRSRLRRTARQTRRQEQSRRRHRIAIWEVAIHTGGTPDTKASIQSSRALTEPRHDRRLQMSPRQRRLDDMIVNMSLIPAPERLQIHDRTHGKSRTVETSSRGTRETQSGAEMQRLSNL